MKSARSVAISYHNASFYQLRRIMFLIITNKETKVSNLHKMVIKMFGGFMNINKDFTCRRSRSTEEKKGWQRWK